MQALGGREGLRERGREGGGGGIGTKGKKLVPEAHVHITVVWVSKRLEGVVVDVDVWHFCTTYPSAFAGFIHTLA